MMMDGLVVAILAGLIISHAGMWYELGKLHSEVKHIRKDINKHF